MTKKQRLFAAILAAAAVVMLLLYFCLIRPLVNAPEESTSGETAQIDPGEAEGVNDRVMLFEQVERANIQSLEVHNEHGTYKFVRDESGANFVIDGHEATSFDMELFSVLVTDCGYTLSKVKVAQENADKLADYGLDEASDPAYYILTTKENVRHKVYVGDRIPSAGGYYVRYDGRDTVYVLDTTLETTVLAPIEDFVTPTVIYPTSLTTYYEVDDFRIYKGSWMGDPDEPTDPATEPTEPMKPAVRFHLATEEEKTIYNTYSNFRMDEPGDGVYYPSGYLDGVLQQFAAYEGTETVKLGPDDKDLEAHGLLDAAYTVYFVNHGKYTDANGKEQSVPIVNLVFYSELQTEGEDEFYYVYPVLYNNIVKVPRYAALFLEYDLNTWVNNTIYQIQIDNIASIRVEKDDGTDITFRLAGDGQELVVTDGQNHKPEVKNFRQFYKSILTMSKAGYVALTDAECEALRKNEDNVSVRLTFALEDGNERVYRFYSYGVQTYYTVNGEGEFYLPTAQVDKVVRDAVRVTLDQTVNSDDNY